MLSVGKLAAGPTAGRYYEDAVALGREDYYASEGEWSGRWLGAGADALGLGGEVQDGHVMADPNATGNQASRNDETPGFPGASSDSWGGTRTPDLTIMSRAL
jgi:hypothetical protein